MNENTFVESYESDARDIPVDDSTIDLVVTSPPYWQKRDYGFEDQIGQEKSVSEYVDSITSCLSEWKRVLKDSGVVVLNLGDTYDKRSLCGVPWRVANTARSNGWLVRNDISWVKERGMPEPTDNRFANRHEYIFVLTRDNDYYSDQWGYSHEYGYDGATPPDVWQIDVGGTGSDHLAPFPDDIIERAVTMFCPKKTCVECGAPYKRQLRRTDQLDGSRPQARRAAEKYEESDLTREHIAAIQSAGITDVGKAKEVQDGAGRNSDRVEKLKEEAKEVLGSYYREFTYAKKAMDGWTPTCSCGANCVPGTVLDPFAGSGTVVDVATDMERSAVASDLDTEHIAV